MKPHALHVPLTDRERKKLLKDSKEAGLTQGRYARELMLGRLDALEACKRADVSDGTWIKVRTPTMRHPLTFRRGPK